MPGSQSSASSNSKPPSRRGGAARRNLQQGRGESPGGNSASAAASEADSRAHELFEAECDEDLGRLALREKISEIAGLKDRVEALDEGEYIVLEVLRGPFPAGKGNLGFDCIVCDRSKEQGYKARKHVWDRKTGERGIPLDMWTDFLTYRMLLKDPQTGIKEVSVKVCLLYAICLASCLRHDAYDLSWFISQ